jgi:hypothetical protein
MAVVEKEYDPWEALRDILSPLKAGRGKRKMANYHPEAAQGRQPFTYGHRA